MQNLLSELYQELQDHESIVLATIISTGGSTPRTAGTRMLIYKDGRIKGTIGGGGVEADVIRTGVGLYACKETVITSYDLNTTPGVERMDLICGGRMEVLVEYIEGNEETRTHYRLLNRELQLQRPLFLVGRLEKNRQGMVMKRSARTADGEWIGDHEPSEKLHTLLHGYRSNNNETCLYTIGDQSYIIESITPPSTVYLVGGGHISKELVGLVKQVGFRVVVIDDRAEFANRQRFPQADDIVVRQNFRAVFAEFPINEESYIIIVTRGHGYDKEVLAQALQTEAGYIGMIGSRRKKAQVYNLLVDEGVRQEDLEKVFCPIGLDIDAETVPEIGVSIAAQLIQHRAAQKRHG